MTDNGTQGLPHHKKLERIRLAAHLGIKQVATRLGMSEREYARLETGEIQLKINQIEEFCKLVNISVIDFFSFDERVFFHNCEQAHAFGRNNTYNGSSLKERELYEARIKEEDEEIAFLRKQLEVALKK